AVHRDGGFGDLEGGRLLAIVVLGVHHVPHDLRGTGRIDEPRLQLGLLLRVFLRRLHGKDLPTVPLHAAEGTGAVFRIERSAVRVLHDGPNGVTGGNVFHGARERRGGADLRTRRIRDLAGHLGLRGSRWAVIALLPQG